MNLTSSSRTRSEGRVRCAKQSVYLLGKKFPYTIFSSFSAEGYSCDIDHLHFWVIGWNLQGLAENSHEMKVSHLCANIAVHPTASRVIRTCVYKRTPCSQAAKDVASNTAITGTRRRSSKGWLEEPAVRTGREAFVTQGDLCSALYRSDLYPNTERYCPCITHFCDLFTIQRTIFAICCFIMVPANIEFAAHCNELVYRQQTLFISLFMHFVQFKCFYRPRSSLIPVPCKWPSVLTGQLICIYWRWQSSNAAQLP